MTSPKLRSRTNLQERIVVEVVPELIAMELFAWWLMIRNLNRTRFLASANLPTQLVSQRGRSFEYFEIGLG